MNKSEILNFIDKYHLSGNINQVIWKTIDGKCTVNFVSDDKTVIGTSILTSSDINIGEQEFGIYTTDELIKMISILNDTFEFDINVVSNRPINLKLTDKKFKMNYVLADIGIIPKTPQPKQLPNFEVELEITNEFINDYIKAKNGLANAEKVAFSTVDDEVKITVGYADTNVNKIIWTTKATVTGEFENVVFSAENLKNVFASNKNPNKGIMKISSAGLMRLGFGHNNINSQYYLVKLAN